VIPSPTALAPDAVPHPLYVQTAPGVYSATGTFTSAESPAASGYGGTSPTYAGKNEQASYGFYAGAETDLTEAFSVGCRRPLRAL